MIDNAKKTGPTHVSCAEMQLMFAHKASDSLKKRFNQQTAWYCNKTNTPGSQTLQQRNKHILNGLMDDGLYATGK